MSINPFLVIGLNTTVLGGLSDEDVVLLVQAHYRALSRIHHPDAGGNSLVFQMVKQAYETLQDEKQRKLLLMEYRDTSLISLKDRQLEVEREKAEEASSHLASFIEAFARAQLSEKLSPMHLHPATILVQDRHSSAVTDAVRGKLKPRSGMQDMEDHMPQEVDEINLGGHSVLRLDAKSKLSVHPLAHYREYSPAKTKSFGDVASDWMEVGARKQAPYPLARCWYKVGLQSEMEYSKFYSKQVERFEAGKISQKEFAELTNDTPSVLHAFKEAEAQDQNWVLVGTVPSSMVIQPFGPVETPEAILALAGGDSSGLSEADLDVSQGYTPERFQILLPQLLPNFEAGRYLVACHMAGSQLRFVLVGEILQLKS